MGWLVEEGLVSVIGVPEACMCLWSRDKVRLILVFNPMLIFVVMFYLIRERVRVFSYLGVEAED